MAKSEQFENSEFDISMPLLFNTSFPLLFINITPLFLYEIKKKKINIKY